MAPQEPTASHLEWRTWLAWGSPAVGSPCLTLGSKQTISDTKQWQSIPLLLQTAQKAQDRGASHCGAGSEVLLHGMCLTHNRSVKQIKMSFSKGGCRSLLNRDQGTADSHRSYRLSLICSTGDSHCHSLLTPSLHTSSHAPYSPAPFPSLPE